MQICEKRKTHFFNVAALTSLQRVFFILPTPIYTFVRKFFVSKTLAFFTFPKVGTGRYLFPPSARPVPTAGNLHFDCPLPVIVIIVTVFVSTTISRRRKMLRATTEISLAVQQKIIIILYVLRTYISRVEQMKKYKAKQTVRKCNCFLRGRYNIIIYPSYSFPRLGEILKIFSTLAVACTRAILLQYCPYDII